MEIYLKKRRWKLLLLLSAVLIGVVSLGYTNWLTEKLSDEERKKVELWAEATQRLASDDQLKDSYLSLIAMIIDHNNSIPVVVISEDGEIRIDANIGYAPHRRAQVLGKVLSKMKARNQPIEIFISDTEKQYFYYSESYLLRNLRWFPIVQLIVIFLFIGVAYLAFSASRSAEQNQVWVGLSKETAHQLGTPISSLMAWLELLRMQNTDEGLISELEKDIQRLEKITERFSKIGSRPELIQSNLYRVVEQTVDYLKKRSSSKVVFKLLADEHANYDVPLNEALFSWVIENLCKNAIDAMDNHGEIMLVITELDSQIVLDVTDTGKGIPKSMHKTIFRPGFSTKKRGWGLGLSLAKRIVENYHRGKIFIKTSEVRRGTTFRIQLHKQLPI